MLLKTLGCDCPLEISEASATLACFLAIIGVFLVMLVLFGALASGALTFWAFAVWLGAVEAILPGLVVFVAVFFLVGKRVSKQVEAQMMLAQSEMQKNRIDRGISILEGVKKKYRYMQFFLPSMIDGQIGTIYYMQTKTAQAKPYLEKAFVRHWIAQGMLGVLYFKKRDFAKMDEVFEAATKYSGKQGLLWSLWAFCYHKANKNNRAIQIMIRGKKKLGGADKILEANLLNVQNKRKMKMNGYGEQWYQFQLELSPQMRQMRGGAVRFQNR